MASVPTCEEIQRVLDEGNRELDREIVRRFFGWARMATAFFQEHGMPQEILSSDKDDMNFFLWLHQGQLIGYDIEHGKTALQAFGLYKGEPIEIHPDRLVIKTYAPNGELGRYEGRGPEVFNQTYFPAEGPLVIPAGNIQKFLDNHAELWIGDLGVEKRLGPDNAKDLLHKFGKSIQIVPQENLGDYGIWY